MNKNYANDSSLIRVAIDETMVVYSAVCKNVVVLFRNKKASAGLSSASLSVVKKKDIIEECTKMGLPAKLVYTELKGLQEKYFCADQYSGNEALCVKQRRFNGKYIINVCVAEQKENILGI